MACPSPNDQEIMLSFAPQQILSRFHFPRLLSFVSVAALFILSGLSCQVDEPKTPPNFLFYIADDLSPFTDSQRVPAFQHIGTRGVTFTHAFSNAPSCTPARGILLTGQPLWHLREGSTLFGALPADLPVFPLMLEEAGYFVGHTGKAWGPGSLEAGGWPKVLNPVGASYQDLKIEPGPDGMSNVDYAANFEAFLADRPAERPFFFWYGSHEPHRRFKQGQGLAAGKSLSDATVPASLPDHEVIRNDILDYDIEVEYANDHFARMIETLEERGELENTVVIVTSDHGMPFPRAKATGLYDDATHIPLMVAGPGITGAGRTATDFVGLMDLGPTMLELAGIAPPPTMLGASLVPQLSSPENGRIDASRDHIVMALERHTIARPDYLGYPMRAIRTDDFLLVHNFEPDRWPAGDPDFTSIHQGFFGDIDAGPAKDFIIEIADDPNLATYHQLATARRPQFELFDVKNDPGQLNNLYGQPAFQEIVEDLNQRLTTYLKQQRDPRAFGLSPWDQNRYYFGDLIELMAEGDPDRWNIPLTDPARD